MIKEYQDINKSDKFWIDKYPSHWDELTLRRITKEHHQGYYTEEDYISEGVRLIRITDIDAEGNIDYENQPFVKISDNDFDKFKIQNGDFLFPRTGSIGLFGFVKDKHPESVFASYLIRFRFNKKALPDFIKYYFKSDSFLSGIYSDLHGGVNQNIHAENIKNQKIVIPDTEEQNKIVQFLDYKTALIDKFIANRKRQIELLQEKKAAIINKAVTKGINPDVKLKPSGVEWIGDIPEHWNVVPFNYLFNFSKGLTITKENLKDEGIPCVNYGEIHSKFGFELIPEEHQLKCVDEDYLELNKNSLLKNGDFVFADTSEDIEGSGNFTYLNSDIPTFAGYHTIIAKPKKHFNRRFVAYFFEALDFRNQIRCQVYGVKVYSITKAIIKSTLIVLPPSDQQNNIVEYIDSEATKINAVISKFLKQIELIEEYKTALISKAVTGKIDVRDWQPPKKENV